MIRENVIVLIAESPEAHGVTEAPVLTERTVYCTERSITLRLMSEANAMGLSPQLRVTIQNEFDYYGEKLARYEGAAYKVVQSYPYENRSGIDLLLERVEGNAHV